MAIHAAETGPNLHVIHNWTYADATARLAATGFVAGDVKKIALQEDNNSLWMLTDYSPITWERKDGSGGSGDASTNTSSSVDSEIALFSSTGGKTLKRASTTGILKGTSGVLSAASAGTDYVAPGGALGTPSSGALTNCTGLPAAGLADLDTDDTLAADSDTKIPSQKAVKKYVDDNAGGFANPMTTAGDTIVGGASGAPTRLALGSALQVRRVNAAGTAEEFAALKADEIESALFAADAGSNDTYVATLSPAISSYVTGAHYRFKANTANTGACTINFNSLGAKTIKKAAGGITTDLADNDIRAGQWVDLVYDGTNMQMQSLLGNSPSGGTPGGSDTQVQFNDGGAFGGDAGLVFNKTTDTLTVGSILRTLSSTPSFAASGKGLEFFYSSSADKGTILSYDRGGSAYKPLELDASAIRLALSGSLICTIDSSGLAYTNSLLFPTVLRATSHAPSFSSSGKGVEIFYSTSADKGSVISYDRAGAAYKPLELDASSVRLAASGVLAATFSGTDATFVFPIIAPAATTSIPSIRLPHGAAPSSPTNGDLWTTTAGLFVRINGATVGPLS